MAFLWRTVKYWKSQRRRDILGKWVRGHTGNAGNEREDVLAGRAAKEGERRWRWEMEGEVCEDTRYWLGWKEGGLVLGGSRRLIKAQDAYILRNAVIKQITEATGATGDGKTRSMDVFKALFWSLDRKGRVKHKNSRRITGSRDRAIRGFGLELLFTSPPPVMKRQTSWYKDIYQRTEDWKCVRCEEAEEDLPHLLACWQGGEVERAWNEEIDRCTKEKWVLQEVGNTVKGEEGKRCMQGRAYPPQGWWTLAEAVEERKHKPSRTIGRRPIKGRRQVQYLFRGILNTIYLAIWLPRCKNQKEKERRRGIRGAWWLRRRREGNGETGSNEGGGAKRRWAAKEHTQLPRDEGPNDSL
ncbi:hypothetical protein BJ684DRAFT_18005 [Piptocephalis cylindrospora]|uniref:RNase H type-1 domain-containing protein n=1 Tax=Piptocephalis cylindrospora TaxID=1907219 RepID=A0A4P9XZ57_9FUNG|nr:hypothetical protein BJ684DRAFT_18005 [Piptocephalis cylindrospora]|eukprot:RKP11402.1 hypothetical protein BJ684DRAFT_18005 [Piptocephalis cylindrospora]